MSGFRCRALLFDLDGVLVDSLGAVERIIRSWAASRGVDPEAMIRTSHGRRTSETLRVVAPHLDIEAETAVLDGMEERETEGIRATPGARELVRRLPPEQWGIVTSGSRTVATLRLEVSGIPIPCVFVTGDQVQRGKPDPECYLKGASQLGIPPAEALVLEDAPIGVAAARAAGMSVVGIAAPEADLVVPDLRGLRVTMTHDGWLEVSA